MYISSPRSSQAANAGRQVCQEDRGIPKSGTGEDMPRKPLDRRRAGREGIQFPQPFVTVNCECLQLSPFWRFNFLHFCLQLFPKSTCKKQTNILRFFHIHDILNPFRNPYPAEKPHIIVNTQKRIFPDASKQNPHYRRPMQKPLPHSKLSITMLTLMFYYLLLPFSGKNDI